jgi:hypothetical protein
MTVGFQTTASCLRMADLYFVQFTMNGKQKTFQENVSDLNRQELAQFGKVDFCGDSLEIFAE